MVTLREAVLRNVAQGSTVSTDEQVSYGLLKSDGYEHGMVRHGAKEYARGQHHTNHVEGFWRLFKDSIRGTHIHVSEKYMQHYLDEFTFRSNHRQMTNAMFDLLIGAV
jgi:hypothetical protein